MAYNVYRITYVGKEYMTAAAFAAAHVGERIYG